MNTRRFPTTLLVLVCAGLWFAAVPASRAEPGPAPDPGARPPAIAVLDFELNDLTPLPGTPEEVQRTASIRSLVEQALQTQGGYRLVPISTADLAKANVGVGYLYDHPAAAAALGRSAGADWVLVGRLHKPSFLFAYLMARLVDTRTDQVAQEFVVEAKGQTDLVTARGAARLAEQIHQRIGAPQRVMDAP